MVSINLFLGYFILFYFIVYIWSYVTQAGLELLIYLPPFPKCCDYWHVPPCLVYDVLRTKFRALFILYKHATQ